MINDKFTEDMFFSEDLRGTSSTAAVTIAPVAANEGGNDTKILSTTGSNATALTPVKPSLTTCLPLRPSLRRHK